MNELNTELMNAFMKNQSLDDDMDLDQYSLPSESSKKR